MKSQSQFLANDPNIHPNYSSGEPYFLEHLTNACVNADAHRTDYYSICLLSEGEMKVETNLFMHHAKAPAFFVIAPEVIRRFFDAGGDLISTVIFFKKNYFLKNQVNIHFLDRFDFFEQKDRHIIDLDILQHQKFLNYFQQIEQQILKPSLHTPDIVRSFIYILINELDDITSIRSVAQSPALNRGEELLLEFKTLLTRHFIEQRQLAFYADKLHITPKHLSTVIKDASGKSAGQWITEMLLLEAKVLLQDKQLTIAQIADKLEFTDPSHFGKFVKGQMGLSPLSYRNKF